MALFTPGFAMYMRDSADGDLRAFNLQVLTLDASRITHVVSFLDLRLFTTFGLPQTWPAEGQSPCPDAIMSQSEGSRLLRIRHQAAASACLRVNHVAALHGEDLESALEAKVPPGGSGHDSQGHMVQFAHFQESRGLSLHGLWSAHLPIKSRTSRSPKMCEPFGRWPTW